MSDSLSNARLGQDEDKRKDRLFSVASGSMSDLPQERKNVIRIFLSSTFTDMKVERNMLMSSVYPRLKKYCQETYKLEFQVVDMRWGVQDQASDDHSTLELCTKEIYNCQKESAGPNFVCLLGDRYGTRYLKKFITEEHWTILVSRIRSSEVKQLLDVWYRLDTNSVIPQRILQPISCIENGEEQWEKSSYIMYSTLKDAAVQAKNDGELTLEIAQTFTRSVTEEEIDCAGVLSDTMSGNKPRCLAFIRRINNINLQHGKAGRFIDITDSRELDEEKQNLLTYLRERLKDNMPAANVKEYAIDWSDSNGVNADYHQAYLEKFCDDFYEEVKKLIDVAADELDQGSQAIYENIVSREVLNHSKQALDKLSKVVARSDILDKIKTYITGDSDRPLTVHGHSGCGKTSIMASVAEEAGQWLSAKEDKAETAVILRFLGTTPSSSDIEHLLRSLIAQLKMIDTRNCNIKFEMTSKSVSELIRTLHTLIEDWGNCPRQLVMVLDSVDQLRRHDMAYNLSWLPAKLPKNVKFVISTLPDIYGILKSAQSLDIPEDNFVEVKALDEKSAWTIIDKWLEMCSRKLTDQQREAIAETFKNRSLPPLYIKLIFDILVKWTSYSQTSSIPTDVISCMDLLFTNLESTHGKVQVQLALAYLTCCPGGISETELEDVLSIDDDFLTIVYQYHIPPTRRIPPTLWVRMKNDIRDYLVEKDSNGAAAWFWYHRQFIEYATRRYASGEGDNTRHCMDTLCEYFTDKWSETPKSFSYTPQQMKKLNLSDPSASSLRYVAPQPTKYGKHRFNARKISVLSQLWSNGIMKDQVYKNSAAYIMDIEFLTGKFVGDIWSNIDTELSDLSEFMTGELKPDEGSEEERYRVEFRYIHAVLKMYSGLISMAPLALSAQLFACLQDKYNLSLPIPPSDGTLPNLAWFLNQIISGKGVEMCPLASVSQTLAPPGGILAIARQQTSLSKICTFTYKGQPAVVSFAEEMVMHIIGEDGVITEHMSISLPTEPDRGEYISFGEDEDYIFGSFSGTFCLISLANKRVDLYIDEIEADPEGDAIGMYSENMSLFYNPHLTGKDSIMFYTCEGELVTIYSVKLRKVVWYRHETSDDKEYATELSIFHASLHDTEQQDVKSLVIVFSERTEFYQMKLLEDGEVEVTKTQELTNEFREPDWEGDEELYTFSRSDKDLHWLKETDIIVPTLPHGCNMKISDKSAVTQNAWTDYPLSRDCVVMMAGKLRSGRNMLAACSEMEESSAIDLYTLNSHDQLLHSASIPSPGNVEFVYIAPESDLLLVAGAQASFYFLSEVEWPMLEVTPAFKFTVDSEGPADLVVDPRGYLVTTAAQNSTCKFWDLTAPYGDVREQQQQQHGSEGAVKVEFLCGPTNYCISAQDRGHVWNVTTNDYIGVLPGNEDSSPADAVNSYPGDDKWQHYISILYGMDLCVVGVSTEKMEKRRRRWCKVLHKQEVEAVTHNCTYDRGMITVDDCSGLLYHLKVDQMLDDLGEGHTLQITTADGSQSTWEDVGFVAMEYCYTGELFIVGGHMDEVEEEIPNYKKDGSPVPCILVYDTLSFTPRKKILGHTFLHAVYFKNFDTVILACEDSVELFVFDLKNLQLNSVSFNKDLGILTFLENYERTEGMYNTECQPFLYILSSKMGLVKLNVTKADSWGNGEEVTYMGTLPSFYGECRVSNERGYIAGVKNGLTSIELSSLSDDSTQLLGEINFQGTISRFFFSKDDKYMTVTLNSGEIVCLKLLDPNSPDLLSEVNKLKCTLNPVCETKEEMMEDKRWKSMNFNTESKAVQRDTNTLYEFVKNYVTSTGASNPKNLPFPLVGSAEFEQLLPKSAEDTTYIPAIIAKVPDITQNTSVVHTDTSTDKVKEQVMTPQPPVTPKPPATSKPPAKSAARIKHKTLPQAALPAGLQRQIVSHPRVLEDEANIIPDNLKLYIDLAVEERDRRLDNALNEINKKHTATCTIL